MKKAPFVATAIALLTIVLGKQVGSGGNPTLVETVTNLGEYGTAAANQNVAATLTFTTATTSTATTSGGQVASTGGAGPDGATGTTTGTSSTSTTSTSTTSTTSTSSTTTGTVNATITWDFAAATLAPPGFTTNSNWVVGAWDNGNGNPTTFSGNVPTGPTINGQQPPPSVPAGGYVVNPGNTVAIYDMARNNGDAVTTWLIANVTYTQNGQGYGTATYYWRTDYKLIKVPLTTVSVDSRFVYGPPDLAGVYQADPNSPNRNVCFNPWIYNGGLFMGNMPNSTPDQSGTGRTQLSGTQPSGLVAPALSDLSIVYLGMPSSVQNSITVGVYEPSSSDPNLNQNQSTVTWATAWTLPTGNAPNTMSFTSSTSTAGYTNILSPAVATGDLILACNNESSFVGGGGEGWLYFASPAYASSLTNPLWPLTDCQPREWILDATSTTSWHVGGPN